MNDPVRRLIRDLTNSILHRLFTLSLEGLTLSFEGCRLALTKEGLTRASLWFVAAAAVPDRRCRFSYRWPPAGAFAFQ